MKSVKIDITGQKFGQLTVISSSQNKGKRNNISYWTCLCDCGVKKIIRGTHLKSGKILSCGCYRSKTLSHNNIDEVKNISAKNIFKKHYSDGNLTFDMFLILTQKNCFYCNLTSNQSNQYNFFQKNYIYKKNGSIYKHSNFAIEYGSYFYNGLDRINSNKPHTVNNVVTCCANCNYYKNTLVINEFLLKINNLRYHFIFNKANQLTFIKNEMIKLNVAKISKIFNLRDSCGDNDFYRKIHNKISDAKVRGIDFCLTKIEIAELMCADCSYCETSANPQNGIYNGIDRINNALGYTIDNSVSCCKYCNWGKLDYSIVEFSEWVKRIKDYYPQLLEKIKTDERFI